MKSVYNFTLEEFEDYFLSKGHTKFRAKQMYNAIYKNNLKNFDSITTIKKDLRDQLKDELLFDSLKVLEVLDCNNTKKYLFELSDGSVIETVLMNQVYGLSLCVTTQVGCNMGCEFCASGELKKVRDLTAGEIVLQILEVQKHIESRISHIVVMGIGEPFDNYENLIRFINIINNHHGLGIGARHITVSTSGIVPKIIDFANLNMQCNLAISLHATTDSVRNQIMPINNKYPLADLRKALFYYCDNTNRRLTIEYVLIKGVNDSIDDAKRLLKFLRGIHCYINLIPLNSVNEKYSRSSDQNIDEFYKYLANLNVNVRLRQEFGTDIKAACGQLRSNYKGVE